MKIFMITILMVIINLIYLIGCTKETPCSKIDEGYIRMLEEENQILGSMLAECK